MKPLEDIAVQQGCISRVRYVPTVETKELNLTLEDLEAEINTWKFYGQEAKYGYNKIYDDVIERSMLPSFADSFYNFIFENLRAPTQKEAWEYYLTRNKEWLIKRGSEIEVHYLYTNHVTTTKAYISRFLRVYPSHLRDFHVYIMLQNDEFFKDKCRYSLRDDYHKTDITIFNNGKTYRIGLDVDTKRCNAFREKKQWKHEQVDTIYFPLDFSKGKRLGASSNKLEQFIVYPMSLLTELKNIIK